MRPLGWVVFGVALTVLAPWGVRAYVATPDTNPGAGQRGKTWQVRRSGPAATPAAKTPRRLILKLRSEACLSCALARGQVLGQLAPGSQLDALNSRFGVRGARPLLSAGGHKRIPEPRGAQLARSAAVARRYAGREMRGSRNAAPPDFSRTYVLEMRRRPDLDAVARDYAADPAVEYCEPDYVAEVASPPNDPYFGSQGSWGQDYDDLWGVKAISAPAAWETTRGANVVVAVVDTGVDYTHPDLAANMWRNPAEIPNNGVDDDQNGYVDDVYGYDFADGDSDPMDRHLHGTHVAGTIAAVGNNATGVVGVAYESQVMAVQGLSRYGVGAYSDLAQAILYAVDNGADVINASWGGSGTSQLLADAIAYAHAHGVVFVTAAGNNDADTVNFSPANDPNAITVAATTHLDESAYFSNFGVKLDVAAPGGGDRPPPPDAAQPWYSVLSLASSAADLTNYTALKVGGRYLRLAGTSMATPHVAGTAALVLAGHPTWSAEQVRQVLRSSADDFGDPGPDIFFGYGRINAASAVAASEPLVAHLGTASGVHVGAAVMPVTGSAGGPGFISYTVDYAAAATPDTWTTIAAARTAPVDEGTLADWDVHSLPDGDYMLRLRVERPGETVGDRVAVTLRSVAIDKPERLAALRTDAPVEIRGTAGGAGFVSYTVEYRRPAQDINLWRTDGVTLAAPPGTPVRDGLLATLDVSGLTAGDRFDFRLTVVNGGGTTIKKRQGIVIDPTLRAGWPQQLVSVADRDYLTVADVDGDGQKEILVGSADEVIVFEPDGSIRPGWPQSVVNVTQASPIVADVTGDAALEVIATDHERVFVWSKDGVLQPGFPRTVDAFTAGVNDWLTAGDLNGDGKDEILCSGVGYSQAFDGNGQEVQGWDLFSPTLDMPMAVGDVFGSGRIDVATYNTLVATLYGGDPQNTVALRGADRQPLSGWPKRAAGGLVTHVGMADVNGDGQLDVVVLRETTSRGKVVGKVSASAFTASGRRVSLGTYSPRLPRNSPATRAYLSGGLLTYGDVDEDGTAEGYLWARLPSKNSFEYNFGQFVTFRKPDRIRRPSPPLYQVFQSLDASDLGAVAIGDIDGDGAQELVAGVAGTEVCPSGCSNSDLARRAVVVAHRDGSLAAGFPKPIPQFILEAGERTYVNDGVAVDDLRYATPAIADLDGDGLKEIIYVDIATNLLMVWNVAGTPGPEHADWPMYHHDAKHTNVLPLTR